MPEPSRRPMGATRMLFDAIDEQVRERAIPREHADRFLSESLPRLDRVIAKHVLEPEAVDSVRGHAWGLVLTSHALAKNATSAEK